MCRWIIPFCALLILIVSFTAVAEPVSVSWQGDALDVYESGFMHMLMKQPSGGVSLFNMEVIENDSPGGGYSEKGVFNDVVWGQNRARKILEINDTRTEKAWLVLLFGRGRNGKYPLRFSINGNEAVMEQWDPEVVNHGFRWEEFPANWLKKGRNVIELYCPEAETEKDGWNVWLSRADEYEDGGGDPAMVGETSFKSTDGGKHWDKSPFGADGKTQAEYTIRISLDRYVSSGWLAGPVVDLWSGDDDTFITPVRVVKKLRLSLRADVPEGTAIEYFLRAGTCPDPFSTDWGPYEPVGSGAVVDVEFSDRVLRGRFVQFKAVLSSSDPLKSPVFKSARMDMDLLQGNSTHKSLFVLEEDNPVIGYPSVDWAWERWDRPEFSELKARENLDGVIAGAKTQFDATVKMLHLATTRVPRLHGTPIPDYPTWDALASLDRIDQHGSVGMCIQFNNLFMGYCMAYGMQGRLINGQDHEMAEVWSDDFGKWVYYEASYANHYLYGTETGEPLSLFELHRMYLDYFYPDRPIDWRADNTQYGHTAQAIESSEIKPPVARSSTTYHQTDNPTIMYKGFIQCPFMRMVPRNDYYARPTPIPLSHGTIGTWIWNGYINWYDDRTPPMRQYTWHTDRKQDMWPDLNLVHVRAATGHSNEYLFLRFETYCPNFDRFEVSENDGVWKPVGEDRWTWVLASGRNTLRVRAVNKLGAKGKPSRFVVFRADVPLEDLY